MRRRTKITFFVAALLGLAVGAVYGGRVAMDLGNIFHTIEAMQSVSVLDRFSAFQASYSDAAHARKAILLEIAILSGLQQADPDWDRRPSIAVAYIRLAILERKSGNKDAELQALSNARSWHNRSYPAKSATDDELEDGVKKMDEMLYKVQPD
jgi:hypothetical protein